MSAAVRIVRGEPDEVEVAALVAGLAAVTAASGLPGSPVSPRVPAAKRGDSWGGGDEAPLAEWTNRARSVRGEAGATARSFGGRSGRHNADAWRWSLRG